MSPRTAILDGIRRSLKRGPLPPCEYDRLNRRLAAPDTAVVPVRSGGTHAEKVERFAAMVVEMQASLDRVASAPAVISAVAAILAAFGLPPSVVAAPALEDAPWAGSGLKVRFGAATAADPVSVTPALCGVAETGTLVLLSGPESPTTLNFLPDLHIAVVAASAIVGSYEEAWARVRARGALSRTVNWITGPSRTADIEQTLLLGAHGPRRLHVILVDDRQPGA